MLYIKNINSNGKIKKIPLQDVAIYCNCPNCDAEVTVNTNLVFQMIGDEDRTIDNVSFYCDNCEKICRTTYQQARYIADNALAHMPLKKLKEIYQMMIPYYQKE